MSDGFTSKKVVITFPKYDSVGGSVKWDGGDGALHKGSDLVTFPSFSMKSPLEPSGVAGHRPFSNSTDPIQVDLVYDKMCGRVLTPLVKGENMKEAHIIESVRSADAGEVIIRKLVLTDPYLYSVSLFWSEEISRDVPPGGILSLVFKYTKVEFTATKFGDDGKPAGNTTGQYNYTHQTSA